MNYREVKNNFSLSELKIDSSLLLAEAYLQCSIDGYVAIPVYITSPRYQANETFTIKLHSHTYDCILITCKGMPFTYGEAPAVYAAAFLRDARVEDISELDHAEYKFKYDYVVLKDNAYELYHSHYKDTSSVWGAFSHQQSMLQHETLANTYTIEAYADLYFPTIEHDLAAIRATYESTALGHYLSLYHLLELSFDFDLLQDLQALGTDLRGFGKIIATYNNSELQKLLRIVKKYWIDESTLERCLRDFFCHSQFDSVIDDLLHGYDKDGFPWAFKDNSAKRAQFAAHVKHSFTKVCVESARFGWTLDHLQRAVAYIIYRFRCAIAHASIGEHILTVQDSNLITTKAIPVIISLISQVHKKTS